MTKVKKSQGAPQNRPKNSNKQGSIHKKKKHQKFKQTPAGKVALINPHHKAQNGNKPSENITKSPQKSGKNAQNGKSPQKSAKNGKSGAKKSPESKVKIEEEEEDDSSSDINEGVSINEVFSGQEDDAEDSSSSSDEDETVPDIFGTSLAEETDDDDDEFEKEENNGIHMFKGLKKTGAKESSEDEEEDDDEEESSDDEEEDDDKNVLGLETLLGASIADESDDEDFENAEESEDSDDITDDDEEAEGATSVNSSVVSSGTENDESDDDDDEDDEEEDDDDSEDIGQLLGETIGDDEDDSDFKEEEAEGEDEDEDISENEENNESFDSTKQKYEKNPVLTPEQKAERDTRTIFVGNVPKEVELSRIEKEFKKFGPIESIRLRGIIPKDLKTPLKVAAIKKDFHPKSKIVCAFITFKNVETVQKALVMNGKKFHGNYLRVDLAHYDKKKETDTKKTVFLGNLPFAVEDNEIWEMFKDCGRIESVRIIRDRQTGVGRGFGYINFQTTDGAVLALDMNGASIHDRELRVKVGAANAPKKERAEQGKKRQRAEEAKSGSPKKFKTENSDSVEVATRNSVNAERRKGKKKRSQGENQRVKSGSSSPPSKNFGQFQGQKADGKKKSKPDKTAKKKKQMAAKLLAKPKKPSDN